MKIVAYEQTLEAQRTAVQFKIRYDLVYLNCLNNIYALAQAKITIRYRR